MSIGIVCSPAKPTIPSAVIHGKIDFSLESKCNDTIPVVSHRCGSAGLISPLFWGEREEPMHFLLDEIVASNFSFGIESSGGGKGWGRRRGERDEGKERSIGSGRMPSARVEAPIERANCALPTSDVRRATSQKKRLANR